MSTKATKVKGVASPTATLAEARDQFRVAVAQVKTLQARALAESKGDSFIGVQMKRELDGAVLHLEKAAKAVDAARGALTKAAARIQAANLAMTRSKPDLEAQVRVEAASAQGVDAGLGTMSPGAAPGTPPQSAADPATLGNGKKDVKTIESHSKEKQLKEAEKALADAQKSLGLVEPQITAATAEAAPITKSATQIGVLHGTSTDKLTKAGGVMAGSVLAGVAKGKKGGKTGPTGSPGPDRNTVAPSANGPDASQQAILDANAKRVTAVARAKATLAALQAAHEAASAALKQLTQANAQTQAAVEPNVAAVDATVKAHTEIKGPLNARWAAAQSAPTGETLKAGIVRDAGAAIDSGKEAASSATKANQAAKESLETAVPNVDASCKKFKAGLKTLRSVEGIQPEEPCDQWLEALAKVPPKPGETPDTETGSGTDSVSSGVGAGGGDSSGALGGALIGAGLGVGVMMMTSQQKSEPKPTGAKRKTTSRPASRPASTYQSPGAPTIRSDRQRPATLREQDNGGPIQ